MKKIISLFKRNYDGDKKVIPEVVHGAEWVTEGQGIATRKFDGACCMIRRGELFKRYDVKNGRAAPPNFEPAQGPDVITGHWPGWIPVGLGPEDKWFREGLSHSENLQDGTYELCGPKINGNPEGMKEHRLIQHGSITLDDAPRTFELLKDYLERSDFEGIVWHHQDGRMVKIKRRDFWK